jgi:hypothetical protein
VHKQKQKVKRKEKKGVKPCKTGGERVRRRTETSVGEQLPHRLGRVAKGLTIDGDVHIGIVLLI